MKSPPPWWASQVLRRVRSSRNHWNCIGPKSVTTSQRLLRSECATAQLACPEACRIVAGEARRYRSAEKTRARSVRSSDRPPLKGRMSCRGNAPSDEFLILWCISETSTLTLLVEPTSAAAIGLRSWTMLQPQRLPEKTRRFDLRFVQADADIAEKIGLVSDIHAQLCPETGSLPPRCRQAEDPTEAQMIVA